MASQPEIYAKIRAEADALFGNGDPDPKDFSPSTIDVTHRFLMECLRMYPIVPMSMRHVMNSCVVRGLRVAGRDQRSSSPQTATHYMKPMSFLNPFEFDIDRYLNPRDEHLSPGYAPVRTGHAHMPRLPVDGTCNWLSTFSWLRTTSTLRWTRTLRTTSSGSARFRR